MWALPFATDFSTLGALSAEGIRATVLSEMTSRIRTIGERCSQAAAGSGWLCAVPQHPGYNWPPDRGIAIVLEILLARGSVLAIPRFNPAAVSPGAIVLIKDALAVEYEKRPMSVIIDGASVPSGDVVHWTVTAVGITMTTTAPELAGNPDDAGSGSSPNSGVPKVVLVMIVPLLILLMPLIVWQVGCLHRGSIAPGGPADGHDDDNGSCGSGASGASGVTPRPPASGAPLPLLTAPPSA